MKNLKKIMKVVLVIITALLVIFILNGTVEYSKITKEIEDFKSRGELVYVDKENQRYFYEIASYETTRTFDYHYLYDDDKTNDYFGETGDITITNRNPLNGYPLSEFVGLVAKWLYVGHATLTTSDGILIESEGKEDGKVRIVENFWFEENNFPQVIGLKVNTSQEEKIKATENAISKVGTKYNWFFLFSFKNSYYCTDLISRTYENVLLNYDGFITTGNDLICSKQTYIYYFQEKVYNNGTSQTNIYYLKQEGVKK